MAKLFPHCCSCQTILIWKEAKAFHCTVPPPEVQLCFTTLQIFTKLSEQRSWTQVYLVWCVSSAWSVPFSVICLFKDSEPLRLCLCYLTQKVFPVPAARCMCQTYPESIAGVWDSKLKLPPTFALFLLRGNPGEQTGYEPFHTLTGSRSGWFEGKEGISRLESMPGYHQQGSR